MSTNICTSNLTSGFIDLATYDEQEKYMYGGRYATAYFVRETRKSTWFTQVPVVLSKCSGSPAFGSEWSVQISRAGDYLLQTWLRVELPEVCITNNLTNGGIGDQSIFIGCVALRWSRNVGHALLRECCITFNDLVAARFDNYHLDFWAAFTTPASKQIGYNNMIGNVGQLVGMGNVHALPASVLNVPLPFFYTRDSGVALPTAALPYNDMRIQFQFRNLGELLIADWCQLGSVLNCPVNVSTTGASPPVALDGNFYITLGQQSSVCLDQSTINQLPAVGGAIGLGAASVTTGSPGCVVPNGRNAGGSAPTISAQDSGAWAFCNGEPKLGAVNVWANYAIVSNDERKRMACAPRDILIEQVQTAPPCGFNPRNVNTPEQYDIRFSHAIKVLFFAVRNKTMPCEHSNYTTSPAHPVLGCVAANGINAAGGTIINTAQSFDPVAAASLLYENTYRLANMGSDFYSLVEPYYKAPTIPDKTGYHMYSYSLDFFNLDPMGSTNYGKLTNVSLYVNPSQAAVSAASAASLLVPAAGQFNAATFANANSFDPTVYCAGGFSYRSSCARTINAFVDASIAGVPVTHYAIYCAQQSFEFVVTAVNNNIVRISGGALGFPVL